MSRGCEGKFSLCGFNGSLRRSGVLGASGGRFILIPINIRLEGAIEWNGDEREERRVYSTPCLPFCWVVVLGKVVLPFRQHSPTHTERGGVSNSISTVHSSVVR